jgi:hypothetical protein
MAIPFFADFYVRQALPQLIGFITAELGSTPAEKAMLLGSFFPGCESGSRHLARLCSSAAFGVLWHACAANTADEWGERPRLLPAMNDAERALLRSSGGQSSASSSSGSGQKQQQQEEGLLSVLRNLYSCPAAYGPVIAHVCDCLTVYSLLQWGPTICEASPPPIHSLLALHSSDLPTKTCSSQVQAACVHVPFLY